MLNTAFFIVGASSKRAGATVHAHVRRYPALLHDTIAITRLQPHHPYGPGRRGIRIGSTIQFTGPGASVQIPIAPRSRSGLSPAPRFPPLGLPRHLPSNLAAYGVFRVDGQISGNP
jgi:hypothetical protein